MRSAAIWACLLTAPLAGAGQRRVVVLYEFQSSPAPAVLDELQAEVAALMAPAGFDIEWRERTRQPLPSTAAELIFVRFNGTCEVRRTPLDRPQVTGTLAATHVSSGEVLPFSDVDCNLLMTHVSRALAGYGRKQSQRLAGRALARVVAHEMWHALTKSGAHGRRGLMRRALTPEELIADHMEIAREDIARAWVRQARRSF